MGGLQNASSLPEDQWERALLGIEPNVSGYEPDVIQHQGPVTPLFEHHQNHIGQLHKMVSREA
jgi:hypothetical protein